MKIGGETVRTTTRTLSESIEGVPNRDHRIIGKVLKALFIKRPSREFRKI
jgi:hypothetical protein